MNDSSQNARARGARRVEAERLAYYRVAATPEFWDEHWRTSLSPAVYKWAAEGHLDFLESAFLRHLPRTGKILEAGCGLGKYVLALRVRGYDCEGVEWAEETVKTVTSLRPDLPVRRGDVTALQVPDGAYAAYISLGVIEHRREGPQPFLREAHRVLARGGVAIFTVPHFNTLRRLKHRLGCYRGNIEGLSFYQFAYGRRELSGYLKEAGFHIVEVAGFNSLKGMSDELPLLGRLFRPAPVQWRMARLLKSVRMLEDHFGHMILFVCRK